MKLEDLDLGSLDEVQEIPHDFELDLRAAIVVNHGFTMQAIDKSEDESLEEIAGAFSHEDPETIASISAQEMYTYDERRQAACNLALVAVVTRLQHWVGRFVKQRKVVPKQVHKSELANHLEALNDDLTAGPVPMLFFEELAELRHSVIHADSQAEWTHNGKQRKIADRYRSPYGRVELTAEQLKDAIEKAIQQVKWYDEKIRTRGSRS
jgi:hypothetical protein